MKKLGQGVKGVSGIGLAMIGMAVALALPSNADEPAATKAVLTVVNQSAKPVYATTVKVPAADVTKALGLAAEAPVELVRVDGKVFPLFRHEADGQTQLCSILSFAGNERMDFTLREANAWGKAEAASSASFDEATRTGRLSNGLLTLVYAKDQWSLAYASNPEATICVNNRLDYWLSDKRHGRLMGINDNKLRAMGLLHSTERATLASGEATVNSDGSVTLVLHKRFPDMGANVLWEESYTLAAAEPVVTYKTRWTCTDELPRYVSYVDLGAALTGEYGPLLQGKLRFKYDVPASGNEQTSSGISVAKTTKTSSEGPRILLSGNSVGFTRVSWRNERCWVGIDSDLGNGLAFSTFKDAYARFIPGNTVWVIGNTGYRIRLLDNGQENQPYEFSRAKPLELGFAIAATCADVGIWNQGRHLFKAVTNGRKPAIGDACSVTLNGTLVKAGESPGLHLSGKKAGALVADGSTLRTSLETDFKRPYTLAVRVGAASPSDPLTITAISEDGKVFPLMKFREPGEKAIDFTAATGWLLSRRIYTLEVQKGAKAKLESLTLDSAVFGAPKLDVPANNLAMTDIATFYRWNQVRGAIDYELQVARSKTFNAPTTFKIRSELATPCFLPDDAQLPDPGKWYWRVRAVEEGRPGQWSEVRVFTINDDIAKRPPVFKPSPEHPLFTMEGCRVPDWRRFGKTLPDDIKPYVAVNTSVYGTDDYIGYFRPLQEIGLRAFLRTHGPGPVTYWAPLSLVEHLFQTYPNLIGIMGGETLSAHYHGGDGQLYVERLLKLCGKYGRLFYDADGSYPDENKFQAMYERRGAFVESYKDHLVLAQKNNILHRQFVSQSSVLGLYLTGNIIAQGAWEDGGWYWQQVGFRKLGEVLGQRGGDVTLMPRIFWTLNYAMGLGRGCSVFSFEGQVGTTPVPKGWNFAAKGYPDIADGCYRNPAAFWTTDGELLSAFHRFCLPFMRGVIRHKLVPTKDEVRRNVRIAAYNDGVPKQEDGDQYYYEWESVYQATYGFRDHGVHPGTLMEFFPNTGRYYYFPVLPQGKRDLGKDIAVLPLSSLMETEKVKSVFDGAYPQWYAGNALVNIVGNTLTILNSNENLDETQTYSVPLTDRGGLQNIAGKIGPHAYVLGKLGREGLWLQANTEYPERDTELVLTFKAEPNVVVTPATAAKAVRWDAATGTLTLVLSHSDGAVEVMATPKDVGRQP
jgi:transposase